MRAHVEGDHRAEVRRSSTRVAVAEFVGDETIENVSDAAPGRVDGPGFVRSGRVPRPCPSSGRVTISVVSCGVSSIASREKPATALAMRSASSATFSMSEGGHCVDGSTRWPFGGHGTPASKHPQPEARVPPRVEEVLPPREFRLKIHFCRPIKRDLPAFCSCRETFDRRFISGIGHVG